MSDGKYLDRPGFRWLVNKLKSTFRKIGSIIPISEGGTGATNAADAREALGVMEFRGVSGSIQSMSGLLPEAPAGGEDKVFYGNGNWDYIKEFRGVSSSIQSMSGLLPEAPAGGEDMVFYGRGEWGTVQGGGGHDDLIAPVESTSGSEHAYTIGDQFIIEGVLYIATAAIAVGDAFVVGTNCAINQNITSQIKAIVDSYVTGVKGNAETAYRTGNVNLTYPNIGTAPIANGGTGQTTREAAAYAMGAVGYCSTEADVTPKRVYVLAYNRVAGFGFWFYLTTANTVAAAQLRVNSTSAGNMTIDGAAVTAENMPAGWYYCSYNGSAYELRRTTAPILPIGAGGTGANTRLNAAKNLTNENVGTAATYFVTLTDSWGKFGYTSLANAKTALGLGAAAYKNVATAVANNSNLITAGGVYTAVGAMHNYGKSYTASYSITITEAGNFGMIFINQVFLTFNFYKNSSSGGFSLEAPGYRDTAYGTSNAYNQVPTKLTHSTSGTKHTLKYYGNANDTGYYTVTYNHSSGAMTVVPSGGNSANVCVIVI